MANKKRGKLAKKEPIYKQILRGLAREFAPNLSALIIFLIITQMLFFVVGPKILIINIPKLGLFLLNFVFAIIVPYNLAMLIKATKLIREEVKKKGWLNIG